MTLKHLNARSNVGAENQEYVDTAPLFNFVLPCIIV